jgi:hypothetical protein
VSTKAIVPAKYFAGPQNLSIDPFELVNTFQQMEDTSLDQVIDVGEPIYRRNRLVLGLAYREKKKRLRRRWAPYLADRQEPKKSIERLIHAVDLYLTMLPKLRATVEEHHIDLLKPAVVHRYEAIQAEILEGEITPARISRWVKDLKAAQVRKSGPQLLATSPAPSAKPSGAPSYTPPPGAGTKPSAVGATPTAIQNAKEYFRDHALKQRTESVLLAMNKDEKAEFLELLKVRGEEYGTTGDETETVLVAMRRPGLRKQAHAPVNGAKVKGKHENHARKAKAVA